MGKQAEALCGIGVIGMGVMGCALAYNLAEKGHRVAVFDASTEHLIKAAHGADGLPVVPFGELSGFTGSLSSPRKVVLLVPASAVDTILDRLPAVLEPGDIVLDFGNSHYADTQRRERLMQDHGLCFIGAGISGGEYGARHGACILGAGDEDGWRSLEPILRDAAAVAEGHVCCGRMGPGGAGHFVKMVHNGIEYADMQLIAESYDLMKRLLGMENGEIADVFEQWNGGVLNSYLIEITARVLRVKDEDGTPLVERILDSAGQKGTGLWTAKEALRLGYPSPTLAEAVFARAFSGQKELRATASRLLPSPDWPVIPDRGRWLGSLERALYVFKLCAYAQGFGLMKAASDAYGWRLPFGEIARIWRGGCIIRARFLNALAELFDREPQTENPLLAPAFAGVLAEGLPHCRETVSDGIRHGIPIPCFCSAMAYYDSLRSTVLPANLIQAQRDFFGAHGYARTDRPGFFHTDWE